jgi:GrpB-like predicted nucleotidyltransferase (UPF0157 family)
MDEVTDRLRAIWVTEPPRLDAPILLAEYDPAWPAEFERQAARIRQALGPRALGVEHVGSTAVPGLAAKPRIDILLVVGASADEASYAPALESAGYTLCIREQDWHEHRVFKGPDVDLNLHVLTIDCSDIERMLTFRDWLRAHSDERERYLQAKRELAARTWAYTQEYADAKGEVVEQILARAGAPPRNDDEVEQPV